MNAMTMETTAWNLNELRALGQRQRDAEDAARRASDLEHKELFTDLCGDRYFLGAHHPDWLEKYDASMFVSRNSLAGRATLPRARRPWALDSGGFTQLDTRGSWDDVPARLYAAEARRFMHEIGSMYFAAPQDWMCEARIVSKTGLCVREHQRRTVENYLRLREYEPDVPWIPVLQGYEPDDYLRHIEDYHRAGLNLFDECALDDANAPCIGIGSICKRKGHDLTRMAALLRDLSSHGMRLHGFGLSSNAIASVGGLLHTADSMAWSFEARVNRPNAMLPTCTHVSKDGGRTCNNCPAWAMAWRRRVLHSYFTKPCAEAVMFDTVAEAGQQQNIGRYIDQLWGGKNNPSFFG